MNMIRISGETTVPIASEMMLKAAAAGYDCVVKMFLESGVDKDFRGGPQGRSALGIAVTTNNEIILRMLLEAGADAKSMGGSGPTPLMYAIQCCSMNIVRMLVFALSSADLDTIDCSGETSLTKTVRSVLGIKKMDMVRILLDAGADPNIMDMNGRTPLFYAVETADIDTVKMLLDAGADTSIKCRRYDRLAPVLIIACENGSYDIVEMLFDYGADLKLRDSNGQSALIQAVTHRQLRIVKLMVDFGITDGDRQAALQYAEKLNRSEIVDILEYEDCPISEDDDDDDDCPINLCCPITKVLMRHPVIANPSGHTYERKNIKRWKKEKDSTDPLTRETITDLIPNRALKETIEEYRESRKKRKLNSLQDGNLGGCRYVNERQDADDVYDDAVDKFDDDDDDVAILPATGGVRA